VKTGCRSTNILFGDPLIRLAMQEKWMSNLHSLSLAVVDDEPQVLESVGNLLESAGAAVHLYPSAQALLEHEGLTNIDCLIADISMLGMDGFELRSLARRVRADLPVILISGRFDAAAAAALATDAVLFLPKPLVAQDLLNMVRVVACKSG
jgi:FixJ family two-component response regulator